MAISSTDLRGYFPSSSNFDEKIEITKDPITIDSSNVQEEEITAFKVFRIFCVLYFTLEMGIHLHHLYKSTNLHHSCVMNLIILPGVFLDFNLSGSTKEQTQNIELDNSKHKNNLPSDSLTFDWKKSYNLALLVSKFAFIIFCSPDVIFVLNLQHSSWTPYTIVERIEFVFYVASFLAATTWPKSSEENTK